MTAHDQVGIFVKPIHQNQRSVARNYKKVGLGAMQIPHVNQPSSRISATEETLSYSPKVVIRDVYKTDFEAFPAYEV